MQPYFFPYIGYFQLMNAVDLWVNMDHATFIKKGFMHKNTIKDQQVIRLPLLGASQNLNTREIQVDYSNKLLLKLTTTLAHKYSKAPFYENAIQILERTIGERTDSLAAFNWSLIKQIHHYLGMETKLVETSIGLTTLKKADGMIAIAEQFGADQIINPIGGAQLYDKAYFTERGTPITFLRMQEKSDEDQLSIFHHLCHYSAAELKERLTEFELL